MRALLLLGLLVIASAAAAETPRTVVRVKLDPAEGVVIGQPVNLMIDVLFAGEMAHPPRVTVPEVAGAQVMRFETQGFTIRDTINGAPAIGQEFTFVLIPRRGGTLTIPAAAIELLDKDGDVIGTATGVAQTLAVTVPPGIDPASPVIASRSVTAKESWSPDPAAPLAAGGALVRTIQRQAADVPALGMLDLAFTAPEGVRVYVDPPVSEDRVNRGAVTGQRTDRVTYVFEKAGSYALPALSQPWWDLGSASVKHETLQGSRVSVNAATAPVGHSAEATPSALWPRIALQALETALALGLLFAFGRWLTPRCRARRAAFAASEAFGRKALREAARSGNTLAAYRALRTWNARLDAPAQEAARKDAALGLSIMALERALFGGGSWSSRDGERLATAAAEFVNPSFERSNDPTHLLPPLNPPQSPRPKC